VRLSRPVKLVARNVLCVTGNSPVADIEGAIKRTMHRNISTTQKPDQLHICCRRAVDRLVGDANQEWQVVPNKKNKIIPLIK